MDAPDPGVVILGWRGPGAPSRHADGTMHARARAGRRRAGLEQTPDVKQNLEVLGRGGDGDLTAAPKVGEQRSDLGCSGARRLGFLCELGNEERI